MSRLGEPREIVRVFSSVMDEDSDERLSDALAALYVCSDEDVSELFGHWSESGFVVGLVPPTDVIHLARGLLRHGIVSGLPEQERKPGDEDPQYVDEFDARTHVAIAMAHLGLSERDSWSITMTALVGALRAKFPRPESTVPGEKAPSKEQHEATMDWFSRVEAARKTH